MGLAQCNLRRVLSMIPSQNALTRSCKLVWLGIWKEKHLHHPGPMPRGLGSNLVCHQWHQLWQHLWHHQPWQQHLWVPSTKGYPYNLKLCKGMGWACQWQCHLSRCNMALLPCSLATQCRCKHKGHPQHAVTNSLHLQDYLGNMDAMQHLPTIKLVLGQVVHQQL